MFNVKMIKQTALISLHVFNSFCLFVCSCSFVFLLGQEIIEKQGMLLIPSTDRKLKHRGAE